MTLWWVNLGREYYVQREAGALWCPNHAISADGSTTAPQWHWQIVEQIQEGDTIVVCRKKFIMGFAIANSSALARRPKLPGLDKFGRWHSEGWELPVTFTVEPSPPLPRSDVVDGLFRVPFSHQPINTSGTGAQVYLAMVNDLDAPELYGRVSRRLELVSPDWLSQSFFSRPELKPTTREALIQARSGQGQFRKELLDVWNESCCATGLKRSELLRASHIKAWSVANDAERLDPYNGLLLCAHYDAAFDKGLITLEDDGTWIMVAQMDAPELRRAGLEGLRSAKVAGLRPEHLPYIRWHRDWAQKRNTEAQMVQ